MPLDTGTISGRLFLWVPRVPAHAAVTAIHDAVTKNDPLDGHVLARAAIGAFVVDAKSALGEKVRHMSMLIS